MHMRRLLSLDGGGIRGLVSSLWLDAVDTALRGAGKPAVGAAFDLHAGSSTGAIIACALGMGLDPLRIAALYRERRHEIFPGVAGRLWSRLGRTFTQGPSAPRYDARGLEHVLRDVFADARMGELRTPTLVTSYDTIGRKPVVFKSFRPEYEDLRLWEVCRASSAAPTYFPAHGMTIAGNEVSLIDGGVVANNPTACAIAEALRKDDNIDCSRDLVVLSVGSGQRNRPIPLRSAREWGALEWAVPIIDVLFDGNSDAVDYIARQLVGDGYVRLQAELVVGMDELDDTSETNLLALEALARNHVALPETRTQLTRLASLL